MFHTTRPALAGALLLLAAAPLAAGPALTVYNNDLAVVREQRAFSLQSGEQTLRYTGVAAKLDPTSVRLEGEGLRLLEQDYDFDLVSADRVLEKYVGEAIKAVGRGGAVYEGQLLAYGDGQLTLKEAGGRVRMLNRAELASVDFPGLPGGLLTRPTLVWKVRSDAAGNRPLTLTYMTAGLSWHAEYVAVLNDDETRLGVNGWVSVDNESGATYEDARLKLMAGDVHRILPLRPRAMVVSAAELAMPAAPGAFEEHAFSDYHLYTLAWPVTLRQAQVKQVELFSAASVPVKKTYTFDAERLGPNVATTVEFVNREADGLGMPLPAGKWRVFKTDGAKGSEFVGEDAKDHTPKDETLRLDLGSAFDVVGERTVLDDQRDEKTRTSTRHVKLELRNRFAVAVTVKLTEHAEGSWKIQKSDLEFKREDADSFDADVTLAANEVKDWEYTVKMSY